MKEQKPTATPWFVQLDFDQEFSRSTHIATSGGDRIATVTAYLLASNDPVLLAEHSKINSPEVRDANASFIVRACNAHQALVDALKNFTEGRNNAKAMTDAEAALKLAEEAGG